MKEFIRNEHGVYINSNRIFREFKHKSDTFMRSYFEILTALTPHGWVWGVNIGFFAITGSGGWMCTDRPPYYATERKAIVAACAYIHEKMAKYKRGRQPFNGHDGEYMDNYPPAMLKALWDVEHPQLDLFNNENNN